MVSTLILNRPNRRRIWTTCVVIFLAAQVFFLIGIQFPRGHSFDEFHYVPSAKQFLALTENQNWEHPPLGKLFMASGIALWGDRPIGWRFMSTVFGALTLVGMYLWGLALFRNQRMALMVTLISLLNQLLYVQSRIGMLDPFMMGFMVWGLASFCEAWNPGLNRRSVLQYFYFSGAMFGLAAACKWMGIIPLAMVIGLVGLVFLFRIWGVQFSNNTNAPLDDWYTAALWKDLRVRDLILPLGVVPVFFYFLTFIPFLFVHRGSGLPPYEISDFLGLQLKMWDGQQRVVTSHPYMSNWTTWPLMLRPIWYTFDKEGSHQELVRGVLLLGNPLIMWTGLLAILFCLKDWVVKRSRAAFLISIIYLSLLLCWMVIPRKIAFYYYYVPAGMTLSLALTYVLAQVEEKFKAASAIFLVASAGLFIYFFPILSASKIHADSFTWWMWFRGWI